MDKRNRKHLEIGYFDFPKDYLKFDEDKKKDICVEIIDVILHQMDKKLPVEINRITYLDEILLSSIESGEQNEQYETCQILMDCRKLLND
jgi:hypothetical protein